MKRPGPLRRRRGLSASPLGSARSSLRTSSLTSSGRLPTGNRARKARTPSEFARIYGSKKRVAWVKAQPCLVAFCPARECENAHVATGGMGRKADARFIVPLCGSHHRELHASGAASFQAKYGVHLRSAAIRTNAAWLAHVGAAAA